MTITDADIVRAASAIGVIGTGSQSTHRILGSLCDTTLGSREIGDIIQQDPGLAVRVLKVANSAYYGRSRDISTLDRAVMVLGIDAVRGIAAAACLDRSVARRDSLTAIQPDAIVKHCVATAFAAEALAKHSGLETPAECFMAALLHDFGIPVQERVDSKGVSDLIAALAADPAADFYALEEATVQVGHARCGEVVFDDWKLPKAISAAARYHHSPQNAPESTRVLTTIVHTGMQLALEAGFTHPLEHFQPGVLSAELNLLLRLDAEIIARIRDGLAEKVHLLT
jgi:putative nucleotidyltransferase with HDIG domain